MWNHLHENDNARIDFTTGSFVMPGQPVQNLYEDGNRFYTGRHNRR